MRRYRQPEHPIREVDGKAIKRCIKCEEDKETTEFYTAYGRITPRCKVCHMKGHCERSRRKNPKPWGGRYSREDLATKTKRQIDEERGWKVCTGCEEQAPLAEFEFDKRWQVYGTKCHECQRLKTQGYRDAHRDSVRANGRRYLKARKQLPEVVKQISEQKRRYHKANALSCRMSCAIRESLNGGKRGRHWEDVVGYTLEELEAHIGARFTEGMTWASFKEGEIEIDHVLPKELFSFETEQDPQFKACWAISNLQPLWGRDNAIKNDFLDDGRRAHTLTDDEKRVYLVSKGYGYLFDEVKDPSPPESPRQDTSASPESSGQQAA